MRGSRDIWSVRGLRNLCAHFLPPPPAPDDFFPFNRRPCFPYGNIQHVLHVVPIMFLPTLKSRRRRRRFSRASGWVKGAVTVNRWTGLLIGFARRVSLVYDFLLSAQSSQPRRNTKRLITVRNDVRRHSTIAHVCSVLSCLNDIHAYMRIYLHNNVMRVRRQ